LPVLLATLESAEQRRKARTMTEAQILQCAPAPAAEAGTSTSTVPGGRGRRDRRLGTRLWSMLHAPALLAGSVGGPGDVAHIEDDRVRLARRQAR
jgi:hypothetical protein